MPRARFLTGSCLVVLLTLLAGCSSGTSTGSTPEQAAPSTPSAPTATALDVDAWVTQLCAQAATYGTSWEAPDIDDLNMTATDVGVLSGWLQDEADRQTALADAFSVPVDTDLDLVPQFAQSHAARLRWGASFDLAVRDTISTLSVAGVQAYWASIDRTGGNGTDDAVAAVLPTPSPAPFDVESEQWQRQAAEAFHDMSEKCDDQIAEIEASADTWGPRDS